VVVKGWPLSLPVCGASPLRLVLPKSLEPPSRDLAVRARAAERQLPSNGAHAVLLAAISIHGWVAGGDGGRRSPELPLACFLLAFMLAVRAGIGGMTVPARSLTVSISLSD
jgi:hypothetical protein